MIIGLTGSIASGKSTVANMLREKGYPIVDADVIAREVVEPGSPLLDKIQQTFGEEVVREDGTLNREQLGAIIFGDEVKRRQLNELMHPAIRGRMISQREDYVTQGYQTVIMDIPLLFESKLQEYVEKIVVVSVTKQIQKQRLMARNEWTEQEAAARIASQLDLNIKEQGADAVIYNNDTLEETEKQLDAILENWQAVPR
ncbi:dephospho-CoA kinase [Sporosarcina sp. P21c]|uniref:dephospho-CoA kinase n=1 Tax=unclassified Sporosarcina TaxID=2647733 RepID=UPI000C1681EA|nr:MULTISPECIES: dephospho-CoA kinase [unclassified Sporosarcina]PIC67701.1 dephospho-CoA kinase [Sporosarcina sp. P16a]PIC90560.1 dephospho-CoA kinase [Sporosarcina sp. P21c]PIC93326.1 dephospho-CoA kinase [Sporosarcina sp. P25]